jgi:Putative lactococcus lactis phage r1t holin
VIQLLNPKGSIKLFKATFWKAALERAVKTFAQTLVAFWGADALNIVEADWVKHYPSPPERQFYPS